MERGVVKWFNNAKGFGYIRPESGVSDNFAHYYIIQMEFYKTMKAGQIVEFSVGPSPRGQLASLIIPQKN